MKSCFVIHANKTFKALFTETEEEKQKGLMYQQHPAPVMVFQYKRAQFNTFWMKNTPAPLDIVFALNGKIVGIKKGSPHSLETISVDCPTDCVVELPYGTCKAFNIEEGNDLSVLLPNSMSLPSHLDFLARRG